jgi:hypothetical protein
MTAVPLLLPGSGSDTIALFPYDYYTLGASGDAGRFRTVVELEPGNSCAGYETREYAFRALGVSAAYTRVTSPDESYTARVRGFMGRQQLRRVDGRPIDREDPISGVAAIGAYDGRGWGVAGGVAWATGWTITVGNGRDLFRSPASAADSWTASSARSGSTTRKRLPSRASSTG